MKETHATLWQNTLQHEKDEIGRQIRREKKQNLRICEYVKRPQGKEAQSHEKIEESSQKSKRSDGDCIIVIRGDT